MKSYLEFESDIRALEEELEKLKDPFKEELTEVETGKITQIQNEIDNKLKTSYANLNAWQTVQVARHPDRPSGKFYIENLFTNFINLSGDRRYGEDEAVIAGFAKFEGRSVLVLAQEKGEDLDSRLKRNFGQVRPFGYRKCQRLMLLADKFNIPVITIIDTSGASPNIESERLGQAEAIASSIEQMISLKVPVIALVAGEGGSGGAIALTAANKVLMLEHSVMSVISAEGCASILWRDQSKAPEAAKALKLTPKELLKMQIIDEIIQEPTGGAHRNKEQAILSTKQVLLKYLDEFKKYTREEIFEQRQKRFLSIGKEKAFTVFSKGTSWIRKDNISSSIKEVLFRYRKELIVVAALIVVTFLFLF